MIYLIIVIIITLLFYILLPGSGAFFARSEWREFRLKLAASSAVPLIDFQKSRALGDAQCQGIFKFFGSLEAIQDKYEVWLRSGNFTVSVDMRNVKIYLIPAINYSVSGEGNDDFHEKNIEIIMDEMPQVLSWERFYSLSQRTEVMVCGPLFIDRGKTIFRTSGEGSVTFLIYDGSPETLLRRGIWAGRHRNEFWNIFTPVSLIAGSFSLFLTAYFLYSIPSLDVLTDITLSLSLVPFMPLFPPGVVLFFIYRSFWKKARFLRAERDLIRLPLKPFTNYNHDQTGNCTEIQTGIKYCFRRIENPEEAFSVCREREVLIRKASMFNKENDNPFYYFYQENEGAYDPLLENVIIEGNPELVAVKCGKVSRFYEYASVCIFFAGMMINFALTFFLIKLI